MTADDDDTQTRSFWAARLGPYMKPDNRAAAFQLASTLVLLALIWSLMLAALAVGWWLTLLGAPLAALLLVRLFIIQHDCGHGSFFSSRRANNTIGLMLGVLTLTPYHYWKRTHAIHHGSSGNLDRRSVGDIVTLTVNEYRQLTYWRRLGYRLYRNPLVMLGLGPLYQFLIKHRLPLDAPRNWTREWRSVLWTNAALAVIIILMWKLIGIVAYAKVQLPISLIAGSVGIWLFYVQHQFEDTYWAPGEDWDFLSAGLQGSSFYDLPAVLHWCTGNIGFHHLHHISSRIPNYSLKRCHREVEELWQAPRLGLIESLGCLRLRLWDPRSGRLVGFRELRECRAIGAPKS